MDKLDQILQKYVALGDDTKHRILGVAFIVTDKNTNRKDVLYKGEAGRVGRAVDSADFTISSHGWIASMSKIVTTVAVMQIVEKGLIGLDEDTRHLIPELHGVKILRGDGNNGDAVLQENTDPITIRQLLSHTSGMSYDAIDPDIQKWSQSTGRTASTLDQTREGWNTPLRFQPGESWLYGSGIDWAGQILEVLTGQTLGDYMSKNIFTPLNMTDTTFRRQKMGQSLKDRVIECCYRNADGALTSGPFPVSENPPLDSGGSGLFSTAQDYIKFLRALLAAGEGQSELLCKNTVDEMFRPQLNERQSEVLKALLRGALPFSGDIEVNHGLSGAINIVDADGKRRKGSMTWGGMSNPHWWVDRESGIAAVLLVNLLPTGDQTVMRLYDELEKTVYANLLKR
ncbi:beta-lactamase/transpeptidase-like protein [Corynespora cassiicola Philippines]|uniref:Beta-lactamase/transpeptidase-like protein n=1 Tax=Corynespora cassiicola Philippines TaxID=1448308 RepID=A0A2T2NW34_CORCC|nr:beta-lactamase/transpeptidase-like protein [Corynespora cassiicola Philippines]